jgi:hypothetical protein
MISFKKLLRPAPRAPAAPAPTPVWTQGQGPAPLPASVLWERQHERLEAAIADGSVTAAARPLYQALTRGPSAVLDALVSGEPHGSLLRQVGPCDDAALMAGYVQLQGQLLWEIFAAFEREPQVPTRVGTGFVGFVLDFERICAVDGEGLLEAFRRASAAWRTPAGLADPAAVVDRQSFDVLQTITNGKYTMEHWRSVDPALEGIRHGFLSGRQQLLTQAMEGLGLSGPVT